MHHRHKSPTHSFAPAVNKTEKQKDISHLSRKLNIHQKQHRRDENYFIRIIEFIILSTFTLYYLFCVLTICRSRPPWKWRGDSDELLLSLLELFIIIYLSVFFVWVAVNIVSSRSCNINYMKSFIMIISTLSLLGRKLLKLLKSKGERNGGQFKIFLLVCTTCADL